MQVSEHLLEQLEELDGFVRSVKTFQKDAKKAKSGFFIEPDQFDLLKAQQLNSIFCRLVWGIKDDAGNDHIQNDEERLVQELLKNLIGTHLLEVGCGSGRLTGFLKTFADDMMAIDSEQVIIDEVQKKHSGINFQSAKAESFTSAQKFTHIFCFENMIGQVYQPEVRAAIFSNLASLTAKGGQMIFGFRVSKYPKDLGHPVLQAMPYTIKTQRGTKKLFGFSINWTRSSFLEELTHAIGHMHSIDVIPGGSRPAGGKIYYALIQI